MNLKLGFPAPCAEVCPTVTSTMRWPGQSRLFPIVGKSAIEARQQPGGWGHSGYPWSVLHVSYCFKKSKSSSKKAQILLRSRHCLVPVSLKGLGLICVNKDKLCFNFRPQKFSLVCVGCGHSEFRQDFRCCWHSTAQPAGINQEGKGSWTKVQDNLRGRSSRESLTWDVQGEAAGDWNSLLRFRFVIALHP